MWKTSGFPLVFHIQAWKIARCTAEKAPEPEPNSSDLDNSPDSEDLLGRLGLDGFPQMEGFLLDVLGFYGGYTWLNHVISIVHGIKNQLLWGSF